VLFQHGVPDLIVQLVKSEEFVASHCELGTDRLQPILSDALEAEKWGVVLIKTLILSFCDVLQQTW